jgi:membrane protease YdiL (CAAX protease family)
VVKGMAAHQLAGEGVVDGDPFDVADRIWELSGRADGVSAWLWLVVACFALFAWAAGRWLPFDGIGGLHARPRHHVWVAAPVALAGALMTSELASTLLARARVPPGEGLQTLERMVSTVAPTRLGLVVWLGLGAAGFAEEFLYRGWMQPRLVARWGPSAGILVTAALFGLMHRDPQHSLRTFAVGCFLGWVALHAKSVLPGALAHGAFDLLVTAQHLYSPMRYSVPGSIGTLPDGLFGLALVAACGFVVWDLYRVRVAQPVPSGAP